MIQLARDARLYPGEGWIDFAGIIERCPPMNYSIELPNQSRVAELGYEEHARRCLTHAKRPSARPAPSAAKPYRWRPNPILHMKGCLTWHETSLKTNAHRRRHAGPRPRCAWPRSKTGARSIWTA